MPAKASVRRAPGLRASSLASQLLQRASPPVGAGLPAKASVRRAPGLRASSLASQRLQRASLPVGAGLPAKASFRRAHGLWASSLASQLLQHVSPPITRIYTRRSRLAGEGVLQAGVWLSGLFAGKPAPTEGVSALGLGLNGILPALRVRGLLQGRSGRRVP